MKAKHPMQPIVWAKDGVIRFKENAIIAWLFETRRLDLNLIATMDFNRDDRMQVAQLLGYSTSSFGDLSYVTKKVRDEADAIALDMWRKRKKRVP